MGAGNGHGRSGPGTLRSRPLRLRLRRSRPVPTTRGSSGRRWHHTDVRNPRQDTTTGASEAPRWTKSVRNRTRSLAKNDLFARSRHREQGRAGFRVAPPSAPLFLRRPAVVRNGPGRSGLERCARDRSACGSVGRVRPRPPVARPGAAMNFPRGRWREQHDRSRCGPNRLASPHRIPTANLRSLARGFAWGSVGFSERVFLP